jgi:hypothetical protein
MPVAAEPISIADTHLDAVLSLGVFLIFAGIVVRALASQWLSRTRDAAAGDDPVPCAPAPGCSPAVRPMIEIEERASRRREAVTDASEPEVISLEAETLAPLARLLDNARRLRAAERRVADELAVLPDGFWLVERNVAVGDRRIPFLVIGATGVFLICASDGAWTLHDLHVMSELGEQVRLWLPGYHGTPQVAVCLAFDELKPRAWFGGHEQRGRGGWVVGVDWLRPWIFGFGARCGLRNGDIRRLDDASGPFWERRSKARLPASPSFG